VLGDKPSDRCRVADRITAAAQGGQGDGGAIGIGQGDADPTLTEVDPQDAAHGALPDGAGLAEAGPPVGAGLADAGAPSTLRSRRKSSDGIDETKPGHVWIATVP